MFDILHFELGDRNKWPPLEWMKYAACDRRRSDRVTFHKHQRGSVSQRHYCHAYVTRWVILECTRTATRRGPRDYQGRSQNSQDEDIQYRRHHASHTGSGSLPAYISRPLSEILGELEPPSLGDRDGTKGRYILHEDKERTLQRPDMKANRFECESDRRTCTGAGKQRLLEQREKSEKFWKDVHGLRETGIDCGIVQPSRAVCRILQIIFKMLKDEVPENQFDEIQEKIQDVLKSGRRSRD